MGDDFNNLETVKLQTKLRPAAFRIYRKIFPDCDIKDLRQDGVKVHVLDQEFGIDLLLVLPDGQWLSVQEKYRGNDALKWLDFTQEYKNAAGTPYENLGEWFKLGAQLYFYGWANKQETDFEKWVLIDVTKYKLLVSQYGGLDKVGILRNNNRHGRASFYAIPIQKLSPAFVYDYRDYK